MHSGRFIAADKTSDHPGHRIGLEAAEPITIVKTHVERKYLECTAIQDAGVAARPACFSGVIFLLSAFIFMVYTFPPDEMSAKAMPPNNSHAGFALGGESAAGKAPLSRRNWDTVNGA